jgi:tripartite ATP-independent transporter DctM subunit
MSIAYIWIFLLLMSLGVPIAITLALAPALWAVLVDKTIYLNMLPQQLFRGVSNFPLVAIPLFILAGEIMNVGGITRQLVRFANALVGHLRGGLAHVNIFSSLLFAGLTGSAVADTSAIGSMLIPAMEKNGYSRAYAAAVTCASSVIGPIIPPSIMMVIYSYVMNVSVAGLFLAGFAPGILMGIGLMVVNHFLAGKQNVVERKEKFSAAEIAVALKGALLPLLTPFIIIGGILFGIFTPTEAAAVAVLYGLILSIFIMRALKFGDLPMVLLRSATLSATILLVLSTATFFATIVSQSQISSKLAHQIFVLTDNPLLLLLIVNIFLLIAGMFLDASPAILILGPVLAPTMAELGVHPLHFAIIMCVNLTVGLATPPIGLVLFVASGITKVPIATIGRAMLPFLLVHVIIIMLITYVPAIPMALPKLFGFY